MNQWSLWYRRYSQPFSFIYDTTFVIQNYVKETIQRSNIKSVTDLLQLIPTDVQLRRMTKTLEMLSEPSVQRISVSAEMQEWWQSEVDRVNKNRPKSHEQALDGMKAGEKDVSARGDSAKDEAQWGNTLPGHGGT